MRYPSNERAAAYQARMLLTESVPEPRGKNYPSHRVRAGRIAEVIWLRWRVGPYQWRLEHLRWFLVEKTVHVCQGTRYRYWLTARLMILSLGHARDWLDHLDGPWVRPTGEPGPLKPGKPMLEPNYKRALEEQRGVE